MSDPSRSSLGRRVSSIAFVVGLFLVALVFRRPLIAWFTDEDVGNDSSGMHDVSASPSGAAPSASATASDIDHFTCPMHPSVRQHAPGKCPICDMELVAVTRQQEEQGVVSIDATRRQLIGVRTGPVVEAPMRRTFRAVGQVTYDESKLADVTLKVQGYITKLFVNETGQHVAAGQPLFLVYSPELYNAQQDFLLATQGASGGGAGRVEVLARAARQRLHLLGLADGQIDAIEKKGTPLESVAISSPASGFVIEKNVVEGASVDAGMRLFRIAALNKVWVEADVYEADLPEVRTAQSAAVTLDYLPGHSYAAKVSYVYPYIDPKTRTGRVRVELANRELELRPGMYASVELSAGASPRLQVPASAVVYTGPRRLVFVDLGDGRFRPQEIKVGNEADGAIEVREGLHAGDVVATSGVFLIAAEARISTAAKYWDANDAPPESSPNTPDSAAPMREPTPAPSPSFAPKRTVPVAPPPSMSERAEPSAMPPAAPASTVYTCPMHPEVRSPVPGKCPKCGMELVPAPSGSRP